MVTFRPLTATAKVVWVSVLQIKGIIAMTKLQLGNLTFLTILGEKDPEVLKIRLAACAGSTNGKPFTFFIDTEIRAQDEVSEDTYPRRKNISGISVDSEHYVGKVVARDELDQFVCRAKYDKMDKVNTQHPETALIVISLQKAQELSIVSPRAHFVKNSIVVLICGTAGDNLLELFKGAPLEKGSVEIFFDMIRLNTVKETRVSDGFDVVGPQPSRPAITA